MENIRQMFLALGRGGRPGTKITPKALVIHWTANTNPGANAVANRNYFENHPQDKVSAHYIVDDREIVQCLPEDEMAYHVGAKKYTSLALRELGEYPNAVTIGIEMCVNSDGDFTKTYMNTVELAADILKRRGWGVDRLLRHYDITGKDCPRFFVADATAKRYGFENAAAGWAKFRQDVDRKLKLMEGNPVLKDIQGHWAEESISELVKLGLIHGDEHGNFRPDDYVTRAEMAVVIERLLRHLKG